MSVCPVRGALDLTVPRRQPVPGWVVAAGIVILFSGVIGYAQRSRHRPTTLPSRTYFEFISNANAYEHRGY